MRLFSFAQALTESAKLAQNCLLVVSLPASDTGGSPHTQSDGVEVGGIRGCEALDRLRNVVGRLESSWRPAAEMGERHRDGRVSGCRRRDVARESRATWQTHGKLLKPRKSPTPR
jgi:hypothetical protein